MPHKRAKRSVREKQRSERGHDLPPTKTKQHDEDIPKSAARVFNALKIREEFHKKRKRELEGGGIERDDGSKKKRKKKDEKGIEKVSGILPGESLQHYNKRVEDNMRPLVRSAVKTSLATMRGAAKHQRPDQIEKGEKKDRNKESQKEELTPISIDKHANKPKEFQILSTSAPRRLNDIVQAPPVMPRLKGAEKIQAKSTGGSTGSAVLSMAQKMMMEQEREKAIKRYREMKSEKRKGFEGE
ncbi:hypothetical protein E1B28_009057 [Marasmius oreades]|uniref:Uncharacterized protein n=1 Tax=Marasmius oreades TaxID=181124 RepID=A0A9P7S194_9AGAR|nr:uncharacterized protein E1B28_009057 [Marasmius oreades]KAG7092728.1 hypothetical protein E1B28_009057 [Marasmius oreades]